MRGPGSVDVAAAGVYSAGEAPAAGAIFLGFRVRTTRIVDR